MNEKLWELEQQAIAYADSVVPENSRYNDIYYNIVCGKLGELIVKECANFTKEYLEKYEGSDRGCSIMLKELFGIK